MSYILDALKKIEHEKSRKTAVGRMTRITGDLFQERKRPAARMGKWKVVMLIVMASVVTFAGTWFALKGNNKKSSAAIHSTSPAPSAPPPVALPEKSPPVPVPLPSQPAATAVSSAAPATVVPVTAKRAEPVVEKNAPDRKIRKPVEPLKVQRTVSKQRAQNVPAPADIKLSGIAWQDERSGRRAVINGFLLKEGASVSGAEIIDIKADRVIFSSPAGHFEILLSGIMPTEVKK